MKLAAILCALILTIAGTVSAETLTGRVVGITDGDTITVLVAQQPVKVRLADIDAPESRQPWGSRSKQSLSALCFNKEARLETLPKKDVYKRTIATVHCAGVHANAEQVRQGMAWVFERYAAKSSPLYGLQREAQAARRGLWADAAPVSPWEWRRQGRDGELASEAAPDPPRPNATNRPDTQPQVTAPKPFCDRKDVPGKNHADVVCGWR